MVACTQLKTFLFFMGWHLLIIPYFLKLWTSTERQSLSRRDQSPNKKNPTVGLFPSHNFSRGYFPLSVKIWKENIAPESSVLEHKLMPKPSLWRLKSIRPIQEQWKPLMPPAHSPDWCTGRAGEHDQSIFCGTLSWRWHCGTLLEMTLWVPSSHPGILSALILLEMKPAASPMTFTYSHSAWTLLRPKELLLSFSPITNSHGARSKQPFICKLKGVFGLGLLCKDVCNQNTKQRIM